MALLTKDEISKAGSMKVLRVSSVISKARKRDNGFRSIDCAKFAVGISGFA